MVVLVAAISPYKVARDEARRTIEHFIEVYVYASLAVCELRDPKGLYKSARAGLIPAFTGIDDPYEAPLTPEIICNTEDEDIEDCAAKVVTSVINFVYAASPR